MIEDKGLTFQQREGLAPLPRQLELGEINQEVKARLWQAVNMLIDDNLLKLEWSPDEANDYLRRIAQGYFVRVEHGLIDEFDPTIPAIKASWRRPFSAGATYSETLGFVEWLVRASNNDQFTRLVTFVLTDTRCAYRLVEQRIMPIASSEEAATIEAALQSLKTNDHPGPRKHLLQAGSHLSQGRFADSVRESVHCVEGLVRGVTGESKFGKALAILAKDRGLHEGFKLALGNLYGYSSDEPGIRHPLLDKGDPNVTERDAIFMLGVCASFATYLTGGD